MTPTLVTENFCLGVRAGFDPPVPIQHHSLLIICAASMSLCCLCFTLRFCFTRLTTSAAKLLENQQPEAWIHGSMTLTVKKNWSWFAFESFNRGGDCGGDCAFLCTFIQKYQKLMKQVLLNINRLIFGTMNLQSSVITYVTS